MESYWGLRAEMGHPSRGKVYFHSVHLPKYLSWCGVVPLGPLGGPRRYCTFLRDLLFLQFISPRKVIRDTRSTLHLFKGPLHLYLLPFNSPETVL